MAAILLWLAPTVDSTKLYGEQGMLGKPLKGRIARSHMNLGDWTRRISDITGIGVCE